MKKKIINYLINTISKNDKTLSKERIEIIKYGLESLYLTITKIVIILLLSLILRIFKEVIFIIIAYNIIRIFAFGLHAKNSTSCLITSIILFIGGAYLSIYLNIDYVIEITLAIICIILITLYAPADTIKRPLINKKKRIFFKIMSTIISSIYLLIIIVYNKSHLTNYLLIGLIEETIMILPITYKMYKLSYNNYKTFNKVCHSKEGGHNEIIN